MWRAGRYLLDLIQAGARLVMFFTSVLVWRFPQFLRMRSLGRYGSTGSAALLAPQRVRLFQPNRLGIDPDAEEGVGRSRRKP
jgi:hypothetical protein